MPQGVKKQPKAKAKQGTRRATGKQKPKSTDIASDNDDDRAITAADRNLKSNNILMIVL